MKHIQKFPGFNKHLRIFILISIGVFGLAAVAHSIILIGRDSLHIGSTTLPAYMSYLVILGCLCMIVMGMYYYLALRDIK